ncbi:MAG: hypothetical protein WCK02_04060 [Bacteroidota bacterium]
MKNILLINLAIIFLVTACKKGEEDPFISILSRKARICREWKVSEATQFLSQQNSSTTNEIISYTETSSKGKFSLIFADGGSGQGTYSWTFAINKDGTYRIIRNYRITYGSSDMSDEEGRWYFLNNNKSADIKAKEIIAFQPQKITTSDGITTLNSASPKLYNIVELKNKKIHLIRNYDYTEVTTNYSTGTYNSDLHLIPAENDY